MKNKSRDFEKPKTYQIGSREAKAMRGLMVTSGHSKYLKMIKEKLECDFDLNQTDNQKFDLTLHTKHKKQHAAVENLLYFLRKMKDHDIMGLTEAQLLWFLQESNYVAKTIVDIPLLPWNLIRNHQTLIEEKTDTELLCFKDRHYFGSCEIRGNKLQIGHAWRVVSIFKFQEPPWQTAEPEQVERICKSLETECVSTFSKMVGKNNSVQEESMECLEVVPSTLRNFNTKRTKASRWEATVPLNINANIPQTPVEIIEREDKSKYYSKYRKLCPKSDKSLGQEPSKSINKTRWDPPNFGSTSDDFPRPINPSERGEPGTSVIDSNANYHLKIRTTIKANYTLQLPSIALRLSVFYCQMGAVKRKFCSPLVLSSCSPIFIEGVMKYALPKQLDANAITQVLDYIHGSAFKINFPCNFDKLYETVYYFKIKDIILRLKSYIKFHQPKFDFNSIETRALILPQVKILPPESHVSTIDQLP